jgi:hypothetical protein
VGWRNAQGTRSLSEDVISFRRPKEIIVHRFFAIIRSRGVGWDKARTLEEQDGWSVHADFMNALAKEGFIVLGGPLEDTPNVLLIARARNEAEIRARLAEDIWTAKDILTISRVAPWSLKLGPWLAG